MNEFWMVIMIDEDSTETIVLFDEETANSSFDHKVQQELWDVIVLAKCKPGDVIGFDRDFEFYGGEELRRHTVEEIEE